MPFAISIEGGVESEGGESGIALSCGCECGYPKSKEAYKPVHLLFKNSSKLAEEVFASAGNGPGLWFMFDSACLPNMLFSIAVLGDIARGGLMGLIDDADIERGGEASDTPPTLASGTYSIGWYEFVVGLRRLGLPLSSGAASKLSYRPVASFA